MLPIATLIYEGVSGKESRQSRLCIALSGGEIWEGSVAYQLCVCALISISDPTSRRNNAKLLVYHKAGETSPLMIYDHRIV